MENSDKTVSLEIKIPEPEFSDKTPEGLLEEPFLTFDEFASLPNVPDVYRYGCNENEADLVSASEASDSMNMSVRKRPTPFSYTLSLSQDNDLNEILNLPDQVGAVDILTKLEPSKHLFPHIQKRSKMFTALQENYISSPYKTYGGLSEWIYVLSGKLTITVIKPTQSNLIRYLSWESGDKFHFDSNSSLEFTLKPKSYLFIPPDYITIRQPSRDTFIFHGEFIHTKFLAWQLSCFDRDTRETNGLYQDRDREIRSLLWMFTAKSLEDTGAKNLLKEFEVDDFQALRKHLMEWAVRCRRVKTEVPLLCSNIGDNYAPSGMLVDRILRNLKDIMFRSKNPRRTPLKRSKNQLDIVADQASRND